MASSSESKKQAQQLPKGDQTAPVERPKDATEPKADSRRQDAGTQTGRIVDDDALGCRGSLSVRVFDYCDTNGQGPYDEQMHVAVPGVKVTVVGGGSSETLLTDEGGRAELPSLAPGDYEVSVTLPAGYQSARYLTGIAGRGLTKSGDYADAISANIEAATRTEVEFGLVPKPAIIKVRAFFDEKRCGVPTDQAIISGLAIEAEFRGERFACVETGDDFTDLAISKMGLVTLKPPTSARVANRQLQLLYRGELLFQTEPGQEYCLDIPYVAGKAEIHASACLERSTGRGREHVPLAGVTFQLYGGLSDEDEPLLSETTSPAASSVCFADLDEGSYTLVAEAPKSGEGGSAVRYAPTRIEMHVPDLKAGVRFDLTDRFCFKKCAGRVTGVVIDADSCQPLKGVRCELRPASGVGQTYRSSSGDSGEFSFPDVEFGDYVAALECSKISSSGITFVPRAGIPAEHRISVRSSATVQVPDLQLTRDRHVIRGQILTSEGTPVGNAVVNIFDSTGATQPVTKTVADVTGRYEFDVPRAGIWYLEVEQGPGGGPARRFEAIVHSEAVVNLTAPPQAISGGASSGTGKNGVATISDVASYPILTEEVETGRSPATAGGVASQARSFGGIVRGALRDVLGWRPREDDPKGFVAALNQSFQCTQENGRSICTWSPRTYAVEMHADMGAVTGAQASLFSRAQAALDKALPLLDGLSSLRVDYDPEDVEATRSIIRVELNDLVNEMGVPGGPRVQRVDGLFEHLLGSDASQTDPEKVEGQFAELRTRFGLERDRVNTIEEEENLTNFLILVDYVTSLRQSWESQRKYFDRIAEGDDEPFLGTQLVLLNRALSAVSESVREAVFAMDSVFLGAAERQTIKLDYEPESPLLISELLTWIDDVASRKARDLIQDAGKDGVRALETELEELERLASSATIPPQDPAKFPASYATARVQRSLRDLATHLAKAKELANELV